MTDAAIRQTIVDALHFANALEGQSDRTLKAFIESKLDLALQDLDLNSLATMELLIALELEHSVTITPEDLPGFASLGELAAYIANPSSSDPQPSVAVRTAEASTQSPHIVRLYRRVLPRCRTTNQVNQLHVALENRMTPVEFRYLHRCVADADNGDEDHESQYPPTTRQWLDRLKQLAVDLPMDEPEPFTGKRAHTGARHYCGPGNQADKTLLVCFTTRAQRMMMPLPIFLQTIDATRFDVLIIADLARDSFLSGVPGLAPSLDALLGWLATLDSLGNYRSIRTVGCSGGGYVAIRAAQALDAERGISIAGRFEKAQHLQRWRKIRRLRHRRAPGSARLVLIYADDKPRDRKFAAAVAKVSGGERLPLAFPDGEIGHLVLDELRRRGLLGDFVRQHVCDHSNPPASSEQPSEQSQRGTL